MTNRHEKHGQYPFGESNRLNNYAISSEQIGEALQRSAASLMAAGNDLDQSIAIITAANTVVQDASVTGTAVKTMTMRLRGKSKLCPVCRNTYTVCA